MPGAGAQTPPVITSAPPPQGTVGMSYLHQFASSPQTPDPTFSVTSGTLPPGLSLSPEGFLSGSADAAGTFGPTTVCASNGVAAPACQTFTITIARQSPSLLAAPSPGGAVGTVVTETASLVGGYLPTGSITFRLFSDAACTAEVFSSTNVVTVNGSATSNAFTPTAPGTYRWTASYSGDANNNPFTTQCDPSNSVTITGTATSTTTTTSTTTVPTSTTTTTTLPPSTTTTGPTSTTSSSTTSTSSTSSTTTSTSTPPTGTTSSSSSSSTTSSSLPDSTSTTTTVIQSTTTSTAPPTSTSTSTPASTSTSTSSSTSTSTSTSVPATTTTTTLATTTTSTVPSTTTTVPASTTTSTPGSATTSTALAGAGGPFVQVSPPQVAPGDAVTVTGGGFPPATPVQAELFSDPVLLGTTTTDAGGAFSLVVTIPLNTSPGLHTLRVRVVGGTVQAETTLTVTAPVRAAQATPGAILSRTGAEVTGPARLAVTLVGLGVVLVGVAWRDGRYVPALARRSGWPARTRWPQRRRAWPARRSWTARRSWWR